jgi:HD-like signal output (HDOD) protein
MSISDADIIKAASSMGLLAAGPRTAQRILAALCDPDLSAPEVVALIEREPGLAARVLKVANSAYYGHARDIATLDRALMVLGTDAVRGITAAACLDRSVPRGGKQAGGDARALVNHCVASAFAAEELARLSHRSTPGEAFIAALLHDYGVPVQERLDPEGVEMFHEALEQTPDADPVELERTRVHVTHARVAQVIFDHWQMPESIVMAALHHDDPATAPESGRDLATIVHLGVQTAIEARFTYPLEPHQFHVHRAPLLEKLGLNETVIQKLAGDLPRRVRPLMEAVAA